MEISAAVIAGLLIALLAVVIVVRAVRIVPQARARNIERLGRYHRTLRPGLNFVIPFADRVYPARLVVAAVFRGRAIISTCPPGSMLLANRLADEHARHRRTNTHGR